MEEEEKYEKWRKIAHGVFDLGYRAGEIRTTLSQTRKARLTGEKVSEEERKKLVSLACSLSNELEPYGWHHHDTTGELWNRRCRNKVCTKR